MFGKGALIFVAGFAIIFSTYRMKLNELIVSSADNFNYHYMNTLVHEAAVTAMNFGVNKVWDTAVNSDTFSIYSPPCTSFVKIDTVGIDTIQVKVVARSDVFIDEYYEVNNQTYQIMDSIYAYFTYNTPVSQHFWYTNTDHGIYWITGDTVWGPMHCNDAVRTNGSPVFYGKVTARRGISPNPAHRGNRAHFYGGWEIGIDASLPTDLSALDNAAIYGNGGVPGAGGAAWNTLSMYNVEIALEFLNNGDVIRTVSGVTDTVALTTIAPSGVISCTEDIRVSGVLNGAVTLYAHDDIWIDDDIVYSDDPMTNPNSDDILGLVSADDVIVTNNGPNNSDVNINGSILAAGGSFTAESYTGRPIAGTLKVVGSIAQDGRGPVGTFNSWTGSIAHGFQKSYYFDPRLSSMNAPHFPYVRSLRLVSWWE